MFFCKHKFVVNITLALLVFLAQFVTIVHATEHPFHEDEAACSTFLSVEHNQFLVGEVQPFSLVIAFVVNKEITPVHSVPLSARHFYRQRAPPVTPV